MIDIINTCIMYRFYTYCKYIIIIVFLFILIKSYKSDLVKSVLWLTWTADKTNIGQLPL